MTIVYPTPSASDCNDLRGRLPVDPAIFAQPTEAVLEANWAILQRQQRAEAVRARRDELLRESDCCMLPDHPEHAHYDALVVYRQALRDVPEQLGFPENVTWPVKP